MMNKKILLAFLLMCSSTFALAREVDTTVVADGSKIGLSGSLLAVVEVTSSPCQVESMAKRAIGARLVLNYCGLGVSDRNNKVPIPVVIIKRVYQMKKKKWQLTSAAYLNTKIYDGRNVLDFTKWSDGYVEIEFKYQ